jgi:hypothetical protein
MNRDDFQEREQIQGMDDRRDKNKEMIEKNVEHQDNVIEDKDNENQFHRQDTQTKKHLMNKKVVSFFKPVVEVDKGLPSKRIKTIHFPCQNPYTKFKDIFLKDQEKHN